MKTSCLSVSRLFLILALCTVTACFDEAHFDRLQPIEALPDGERDAFVMTQLDSSLSRDMDLDSLAGIEQAGIEQAGIEQAGIEQAGHELGEIVGRWVSAQNDVAPLLREAPLSLSRLEATFQADQSFNVIITNQNGESFSLAGQYSVLINELQGQPHRIELNQSQPEASLSRGIFTVIDDVLTYEVVQIEPPLPGNNTPPQSEQGFGSSNRGELGSDNVQVYRKVP